MARALHLGTRLGALCDTDGIVLRTTPRLSDVTCLRCQARYVNAKHHAEVVAWEARHRQQIAEAASSTGLGDLWAFVSSRPDDPSSRNARNIIAAVILWASEAGFRAEAAA